MRCMQTTWQNLLLEQNARNSGIISWIQIESHGQPTGVCWNIRITKENKFKNIQEKYQENLSKIISLCIQITSQEFNKNGKQKKEEKETTVGE